MFERLEKLREARKDAKGFTLIELLIVIVILGVLAAIVVFAVGGITDRGNDAACKSDLKTVQTAAEAYFAQKGSYPATATVKADLVPLFLHSFPTDVTYAAVAGPPATFTVTGIDGSGATPKSNDCSAVTV
jgi:general secretion pathway protein G